MNTEKVCGVYFTFTQSWCPDSLYLHIPRLTLPRELTELNIEHLQGFALAFPVPLQVTVHV